MFLPGDKVRIKERLEEDTKQPNPGIEEDMYDLCGKVCTISGEASNEESWYYLDEVEWVWCEEWLEPIEPVKTIYTSPLLKFLLNITEEEST